MRFRTYLTEKLFEKNLDISISTSIIPTGMPCATNGPICRGASFITQLIYRPMRSRSVYISEIQETDFFEQK